MTPALPHFAHMSTFKHVPPHMSTYMYTQYNTNHHAHPNTHTYIHIYIYTHHHHTAQAAMSTNMCLCTSINGQVGVEKAPPVEAVGDDHQVQDKYLQ